MQAARRAAGLLRRHRQRGLPCRSLAGGGDATRAALDASPGPADPPPASTSSARRGRAPASAASFRAYANSGADPTAAVVDPDGPADPPPAEAAPEELSPSSTDAAPWLRDFRAGMLQPRIVPFQVSAAQAGQIFEAWHAARWLAPRGLLRGAEAGGGLGEAAPSHPYSDTPTIRPTLLPFWLFETGVHVEYRGEILVPAEAASAGGRTPVGAPATPAPASATPDGMAWADTGWRSRGYREYPWTLSAMQVCGSYAVRRDLAAAAAVPGFLGRSRPLRRAEAEAGVALDVGWADVAGRGDEAAALAPRDMRQAVAWALAMQAVRRCELRGAARALGREAEDAQRSGGGARDGDGQGAGPHAHRRPRPAPHSARPSAEDVGPRTPEPPSLWARVVGAWARWASGGGGGATTATKPRPAHSAPLDDLDTPSVRNVRVRIRPSRRRARVVYLPAFRISYTHGERRLPTGEKRPAEFEALVSGLDDGAPIAAERHVSPAKAQAVAAAAAALVGGAAAMAGGGGGWPPDPVPVAFWAFMCGAGAGAAARASTHVLREADEAARLAAEEAAFERFSAASGLGPLGADPDADAELEAAEWRRWEEADRWCWDAARRGEWAEALATDVSKRRAAARRARADAAAAASRMAADADAEQRRAEKHGGGRAHHHHGHHRASPPFLGAAGGSRPADHLGLYRALGLGPPPPGSPSPPPPPSPEDVRAAFRRAALRWHPDRQPPGDAAARRRAARRFADVRVAYETLRDPRRRAAYDQAGGWWKE